MRLFWVEWRRLRTRRIIRAFLVIALLNIVISGVWVFLKSNRDLAGAEAARQEQIRQCVEGTGPGGLGDFGPAPPSRIAPTPGEDFDPTQGFFCESFAEAKDPRFHLADLPKTFEALSLIFVFAMWGLSASFIGAEWEAGTVGMLLTHEPRRVRVLVTKLAVVVGFAVVTTTILLALLSLALLPAAILRGTTEGTTGAWIGDVAGLGLRIIATAGLAAVFGFSLATSARRTSVAFGALLLAFLFEIIISRLAPGYTRWQFTENLARFATGSASSDAPRSVAGAGILLTLYAAGVFTLTTLGFQRRDVV